MQKIQNLEVAYSLSEEEVPKEVHNHQFSEQNIKRLRQGLKTNLIEGIETEDGEIINAKIQASKNEKGDIVIDYHIQQEQLEIPTKIFGKPLSDKQMNSLLNGELINFSFKDKNYFIGVDKDLNKITIETENALSIPSSFGNYNLDQHDKLMMANGKATNERLFQTNKGDYYLARLMITENKKGIEILNIKSISIARAVEIEKSVNKPIDISKSEASLGDITEDTLKSFSVSDGVDKAINHNSGNNAIDAPKGTHLINEVAPIKQGDKTYKQFEILKTDVKNNVIELKADKVITPPTFKGVPLTTQQKDKFENFEKVLIIGANNNFNQKQNVEIWKTEGNKFNMNWVKPNQDKAQSKAKSKTKSADLEQSL